jgi:hypothetical protein
MAKKTLKNNNHAVEIGAGAVAAAAFAVASGYVLWEKMGKQKQAKVKAWVVKARKEAAGNIAKAKKTISEVDYQRIVDAAVVRYGAPHGLDKAELAKVAADLKADWKNIQGHAKVVAKQLQEQHEGAAKKSKPKKKEAKKR